MNKICICGDTRAGKTTFLKAITKINGNKQMPDVWHLPAIARWEKSCGKHPTQKPLSLLSRIILSSTPEKAWILDPFCGSGTTGIAANLLNRQFLGIDIEEQFLDMAKARRQELDIPQLRLSYISKIKDLAHLQS